MPATSRPLINKIREAACLQDALVGLRKLARTYPIVAPLEHQASKAFDETLKAIGAMPPVNTRSTRLIEHGADIDRLDATGSDDLDKQAHGLILDMLRDFRDIAIETIDVGSRAGETSPPRGLGENFSRIRRSLEQWLASPDDIKASADAMESLLAGTIQPGGADQVQAAIDELIDIVERASGASAGPRFETGLSESLFQRWADSPPSEDTIRRFFDRYHL
jgi:hypothetical protein